MKTLVPEKIDSSSSESGIPPRLENADILVVDDISENLELLVKMLGDLNYTVRPVLSGETALQAARSKTPDVILLDVSMPGMDGYETCAALKADPKTAGAPVIFVSAMDDVIDKVRGFEVGGIDYVTKPLQIEELDARLQTHAQLRRLQLEREGAHRQLRQNHKSLKRLERLRDDLTHMLAHDLRNPLSVVSMTLGSVQMRLSSDLDPVSSEMLEEASSQISLMANMIDELIDVRRLEEGSLPLELDNHSPAGILAEALSALKGRGRIVSEGFENLRLLTCDSALIRRVLMNLLGNAVKFTPVGGEVRVVAIQTDEMTRFEVHDRGPGIDPEHHDAIFRKFWQGKTHSGEAAPSSGLGLSFCKMVVQAHGGRIGVESRPGQGSCFWLELPAAAKPINGVFLETNVDEERRAA